MAFTAQEFEILSEKTMLFLLVLNREGKIVRANKRCKILFGASDTNVKHKLFEEFILDADVPVYRHLIQNICDKNPTKILNLRFGISFPNKGIISLKFDFVCHDGLIYATGIDTTDENKEHNVLVTLSKLTKTGTWSYNPTRQELIFSECCQEILNLYSDTKSFVNATKEKTLIDKAIHVLLDNHKPFDYIEKLEIPEKDPLWYRVVGEPVVHDEKVIFINGTVSDVTKHYKHVEQLRYNEETKHLALKGIKSGLFDHLIQTNMVFYSTDFRKMLGLPVDRDFVPEETFRVMIHPDDVDDALQRHLENLKKPGYYYFNYYRLKHLNEGYRHYEVYGYRKKDAKGNTVRMIGNLIDVHQRKINEKLIEENQSRLYAMINNGFTYTLLLNPKGHILMADRDTIKIILRDFGVHPTENSVRFIDVMPLNFKNSFAHEFNEALKGNHVRKEIERTTHQGAGQWLEAKYTPIKDKSDTVNAVLVSFHDITEIKSAALATKQAHIKEQELSTLKSNILSNFSHEIRTPLNGIMTICNLILNADEIIEDKDKLLEFLDDSKNRLLETMNSLSHYSEIETIKNNLNYTNVDINYTVETSFREYRHMATSKNLNYTLELDEKCPVARIDTDLFSTSLNNIIHNAIKYTDQGKITINITSSLEKKNIRISIKDTGIGIKKNNLKTIFDPFVQESIGLSRKYEGTGIGLSLSKRYIELLGGKLDVASKHRKGTVFTITIPQIG